MAYLLYFAQSTGVELASAALSFGLAKFARGVCLLLLSRHSEVPSFWPSALFATVLGSAILVIFLGVLKSGFIIWFFALQLCLNRLSAELQGSVLASSGDFGARWLGASILVGFMIGAPACGLAISGDAAWLFVVLSALTSSIPLAWRRIAST